ncbi:GGDEF domain-containing response regulator [Paucidesulfovibrio longus]|uniref:GGDEF domain-containing response regulator n=1 Tax=Paucidesulfovibrio longus TaxID=889 RepID=UPI0003B67CDC|nr:diguanylate cyclase [Paucidesulfovibrio longus]
MSNQDTRQKILIVDDNKQNIELLMDLFRDEYKIAAATNGERALKIAFSSQPPDIILTDILMPGMDGYELCNKLKEHEQTRSIPVMFVTAVSEVMDETRGFALGAVDYITKPFHPPMVKARVGVHLNLKRKQELLEEYAFIDALTEIPNRRRFDEVAEKEWQRALRSSQHLSLILLDIDHFKLFNDTYGHGEGDETLRAVAKAIQKALRRAGDFVARYGGEEFAAILPYADAEEALHCAGEILEAVKALDITHAASPVADKLTVSLGLCSTRPSVEGSLEAMLAEADKALYLAKNQGRNCFRCAQI